MATDVAAVVTAPAASAPTRMVRTEEHELAETPLIHCSFP